MIIFARLMRPLVDREEITISYIDQFATRKERREELLKHYHFDIDQEKEALILKSVTHKLDTYTQLSLSGSAVFHSDPIDNELMAIRLNGKEADGGATAYYPCNNFNSNENEGDNETKHMIVFVWGGWHQNVDHSVLCEFALEVASLFRLSSKYEAISTNGDHRSTVVSLQQLQRRVCGELKARVYLGRHHLLRARVNLSLMKLMVDEGKEWDSALRNAQELKDTLALVLHNSSPRLGLHFALLAKMEVFCGHALHAVSAGKQAIKILSIVYHDLPVFDEVRRTLYEAQSAMSEESEEPRM